MDTIITIVLIIFGIPFVYGFLRELTYRSLGQTSKEKPMFGVVSTSKKEDPSFYIEEEIYYDNDGNVSFVEETVVYPNKIDKKNQSAKKDNNSKAKKKSSKIDYHPISFTSGYDRNKANKAPEVKKRA